MYVVKIHSLFHRALPVKEIKKCSEKAQFLVVAATTTTTYCGPLVGKTKVRRGNENMARLRGKEDVLDRESELPPRAERIGTSTGGTS
jgi:hypothetical protein